jgi:formylglycine-generating enzyme required for sulfatase activity
MPDETCSRDEDLRDWLAGRLPVEVAERLFAHLDRCPRCQSKLETVADSGDTLIDCLRKRWVRDELLEEPQFQEALARAKAIGDADCEPGQGAGAEHRGPDILGALGEYQILEKLAEGGMGTVYKALHTRLDRIVALKVLPGGGLCGERAIARFEQEMKLVGQLDHPHFAHAVDAGEIEGTRFLVLEYIEGVDLSQLIHEWGPLPVVEACRLVRQAAVGLQYAHEHDLIHRDVKPSNLMVEPHGQLKILDLGLARLRLADSSRREMTRVGQTMGTAEYMAPEQATDSHSVDVRADIYSLGCTLHYLLIGRAPYAGGSDFQILTAHHESPIPSLCAERDDVPEDLDRVFGKMVGKTPEERHASMTEVINDLERFVPEAEESTDGAVISPTPTTTSQFPTNKRRVVAALLVGAIAATILLAGLIVKFKPPTGRLLLSVDQEDAEVVIDDGKLTFTTRSDPEPSEIRLAEGEHSLTVSKAGFLTRTETFTIQSGGHEVVNLRLVPLTVAGSGQPEPTASQLADRQSATDEPPPLAVAPFDAEQAKRHQQAWADYLGLPVEWENSLGMVFVLIPPGEFVMGSSKEEQERFQKAAESQKMEDWRVIWISSEGPQHPVKISQPFYLGKHEVTQAQWAAAMGHNPSAFQDPAGPVANVSWHDVQLFLRLTGPGILGGPPTDMPQRAWEVTFTIPTEAQWEHACRAGTDTAFVCGDNGDLLDESAWFLANSEDQTHAVGQLKPNPWGLCDMHGNAWEWCADRFAADYYAQAPRLDPIGPPEGLERAYRGGCYGYPPCFCRSAMRCGQLPDFRYYSLGFRLAALLTGKR